ncbi:hypothetical protein MMC19_006761 [Ptychographa xylographoides]|nr:hypothetical protein [Ptychographa xylographoides]
MFIHILIGKDIEEAIFELDEDLLSPAGPGILTVTVPAARSPRKGRSRYGCEGDTGDEEGRRHRGRKEVEQSLGTAALDGALLGRGRGQGARRAEGVGGKKRGAEGEEQGGEEARREDVGGEEVVQKTRWKREMDESADDTLSETRRNEAKKRKRASERERSRVCRRRAARALDDSGRTDGR